MLKDNATKIGIVGLFLWAFAAFFNSQLSTVPVFEILTIALGIGFIGGLIRLSIKRSWHKLKQPMRLYSVGFIGVFGNELLYVSSFKYAPAAHIVLINYLWPILVVLLASWVLKEKFSWRYFLAAILSFGSIAVFVLRNETMFSYYWVGYLLAFLGACFWSLYILVYRLSERMTPEMLTCYCGVGCLVSLAIHLQTEKFYMPTQWECLSLTWLGLIGMCIAFNFWNFGVKNGNVKLLSLLSYNNIVLSTGILTMLGEAYFEPALLWTILGLLFSYSYILKTN